MSQSLSHIASSSRIWIFQSDRFLSEQQQEFIKKSMQEFASSWTSHGSDVNAGFTLEKGLFLIVGIDETKDTVCGRSVDGLARKVKELGTELNIDFFNRMAIAYENNGGEIEITSMNEFKRFIQEGKVNENTIVFNNLVSTKEEFDTQWRTAVKNSWHTNLFQLV